MQVVAFNDVATAKEGSSAAPEFRASRMMHSYAAASVEVHFLQHELRKSVRGYVVFLVAFGLASFSVAFTSSFTPLQVIGLAAGILCAFGVALEGVHVACASCQFATDATIREVGSALVLFATNCVFGYGYQVMQKKCFYMYTFDNREHDTRCPFQLYPFWFWSLIAPVVVGRPRGTGVAIAVVPCLLLPFVLRGISEGVHRNYILSFAVSAAFAALVLILKLIDERQHRRQFEAHLVVQTQADILRAKNTALIQFVSDITPKHLRSRLTARTPIVADIATNAVCAVMDLDDCASFMISMLPMQSALAVATYVAQCTAFAERHGVHTVRNVGDVLTFVSSLFDAPPGEIDSAALEASVVSMVRFALASRKRTRLNVRCGVAMGELLGMPLGYSCIRYDVVGPALNEAHRQVSICPARKVRLSQAAHNLLVVTFTLTDDGVPPSASASGSGSSASSDGSPGVTITEMHVGGGGGGGGGAGALLSSQPDDVPAVAFVGDDDGGDSLGVADGSSAAGAASAFGLESLVQSEREILRSRVVRTALPRHELNELNLSLKDECCCCALPFCIRCGRDFQWDATEEAHLRHLRASHRAPFVICCAFYALFSVVLLVASIVDRNDHLDSQLVVACVLFALTVVAFSVIAVVAHSRSDGNTRLCIFLCYITTVATLIAVNLTRPSIVGDDSAYITFAFAASCIFWGERFEWTATFQVLYIGLFFALGAFRPILTFGTLTMLPIAVLIMVEGASSRYRQHRDWFIASTTTTYLLAEIQDEEQVRVSILESILPSTLHHLISAESIKNPRVDAWAADDLISLFVSFADSGAVDGNRFQKWAADPDAYRRFADGTVEQITAAVKSCGNRSLYVVKVFGGTVLIAGPLAARGDTVGLEGTVADTHELLAKLLHIQREGSARLTVGVAVEQMVQVLRYSAFPNYDIFGPSVTASRSLMQAAPVPMVVVSEKMATLLGAVSSQMPLLLHIRAGEMWRLRNVGSVKVHRVVLHESVTS